MADDNENIVKSLDKISEKLENIDKTIKEIGVKPKEKSFDKDIELQKIQLLNDDFESYFGVAGSILTGGFVSLTVLILTIFLFYTIVALVLVFAIGVIVAITFVWLEINKRRFFTLLDELIDKVRNKEALEPITELRKKIKVIGK
jgi:hypothetical protein